MKNKAVELLCNIWREFSSSESDTIKDVGILLKDMNLIDDNGNFKGDIINVPKMIEENRISMWEYISKIVGKEYKDDFIVCDKEVNSGHYDFILKTKFIDDSSLEILLRYDGVIRINCITDPYKRKDAEDYVKESLNKDRRSLIDLWKKAH
jgi:hypothetical protein